MYYYIYIYLRLALSLFVESVTFPDFDELSVSKNPIIHKIPIVFKTKLYSNFAESQM